MPTIQDKNETEDEDIDTADSDKSDEDESMSASGTEEESSGRFRNSPFFCNLCWLPPFLTRCL